MNNTILFKRLKNGLPVESFYKKNNDISYSLLMHWENNLFSLRYYYLDGNNVFDEDNYKEENTATFSAFDDLILFLQSKFPGLEIRS